MSAGEAIWLETTRTKVDYWTATLRVLITRPEVFSSLVIANVALNVVLLGVFLPLARRGDVDYLQILIAGALPTLALLLVIFVWAFFVARQLWRKPKALTATCYVYTTYSLAASPPSDDDKPLWMTGVSALETESLVVVHAGRRPLHVLPKRDVTPEVLGEVKARLRSALKGRVHFLGGETY